MNNKNCFYGPNILQAFEFDTFGNSLVLQNNLTNIEDVNIITKSKDGDSSKEIEINWTYYSTLPKLVRHFSWIWKIKHNWMIRYFTQLSTKDTNNGLETLIKTAQHKSFPLEITNLLPQKISTATAEFYCCLHLLIKKYLTYWRKIKKY